MRSARFFSLSVLIFVILCGVSGEARDTGIVGVDFEFYRPAVDAHGFFGVNGARLQKRGRFFLSASQSFAAGHLFEIAVRGVPAKIVERVFTTELSASVGLADFVTAGLSIPIHAHAREADLTTAAFNTQSMGDLRLSLKWRLSEEGRWPGLALLTTLDLPTGNERKFLGTGRVGPGLDVIAEKKWKYLRAAVNLGAAFPKQTRVLGLSFDDYLRYGAAAEAPLSFLLPRFYFVSEVRGRVPFGDPAVVTSPVEFTAGVRKDFDNGFSLAAGAGGALNNAAGNPRVRGLLTLTYAWGAAGGPGGSTVVYFRPGVSRPTPESEVWARETARRLKGRRGRVTVEGHADGTGTHRGNERLSRRRAESVKKILVEGGVPRDRVEVRAFGSSRPAVDKTSSSARRLNRRAEIRWLK